MVYKNIEAENIVRTFARLRSRKMKKKNSRYLFVRVKKVIE